MRRRRIAGRVAAIFLLLASSVAAAQTPTQGTGLPLPRFVSLRADEVNMRTGPGVRYPVDWVYKRRDLPIEVIAEFGTWRKVRDVQGTQGWVHQTMLSAQRTISVTGGTQTLRVRPGAEAEAVARLEPDVVGRLLECPEGSTWCRVDIAGHVGWLRRSEFWGSYPGEIVK
jgi:SH3-like domain-containing protein